nr:7908_t:CDS:2 [Entrophospora candida]
MELNNKIAQQQQQLEKYKNEIRGSEDSEHRHSASLFTLQDVCALRANFRSAREANLVILNVNAELDIGTSEAVTDTLVAHLIFLTVDFNEWPLVVK